jgi:hypothetical protein
MYKGTKRGKKAKRNKPNQHGLALCSVFFLLILSKKNIRGNSAFFFPSSCCVGKLITREKEREKGAQAQIYIYSGERKSPKKEKEKT